MHTDKDILDVDLFVNGIKDRIIIEAIKEKIGTMQHSEVEQLMENYRCLGTTTGTLAYSIYNDYQDRNKKKRG